MEQVEVKPDQRVGRGFHPNQRKSWIKKGQVLNPGGRKKGSGASWTRHFLDSIDQTDKKQRTRWEIILEAMMDQVLAGNVQAAQFLADRGYGKVKEVHDLNVDNNYSITWEIIRAYQHQLTERKDA